MINRNIKQIIIYFAFALDKESYINYGWDVEEIDL